MFGLTACRDETVGERIQRTHGIVPGTVNELEIGGTRFRFPANLLPTTGREDNPVKGVAEVATVHIDLSSLLNRPPQTSGEEIAWVRIEIRASGYENDAKSAAQLAQGRWHSIAYRPEYGLREYISELDDGGWGYRTYESVDTGRRAPTGGRIVFSCVGRPGADPSLCRTFLQHPRGPIISYYVSGMLMPQWWRVHKEVWDVVNKLTIK